MKQPSISDNTLADVLVPTSFATMAILNRIAAENNLSLSLIRVLGILRDRRPRMTELADYLGVEKHTMSGLIARAEKRGLIARGSSAEDGRAINVFLTSQGAELVKDLYLQVQQALIPLTEKLSVSDKKLLHALHQRMLGI